MESENINLERQNQRIKNLENLVWSLFRALETYITVSELETQTRDENET